jgi:hypothetical protein
VIGRVARNRDLMEAEAAFTRQLDIATTHGMAVWVVRATRELGAVDPMSANRTERLRRARGRRLNGRSVDVPATGRRSPSRASAPGRSSRLNSMMHRVVAVAGQRVGVAAADNIVGPRG